MKQTITLFLLFVSLCCNAQTTPANPYATVIKEQAAAMNRLFLKKDFNAFTKFIYPEIVTLRGGEAETAKAMKKGIESMEAGGATIQSLTFGEPTEIIVSGEELQCILPQQMEMKMKRKKIVGKSFLIAISKDNGKKWYFVDATSIPIDTIRDLLPNLSKELVIPDKEPPVITEE